MLLKSCLFLCCSQVHIGAALTFTGAVTRAVATSGLISDLSAQYYISIVGQVCVCVWGKGGVDLSPLYICLPTCKSVLVYPSVYFRCMSLI